MDEYIKLKIRHGMNYYSKNNNKHRKRLKIRAFELFESKCQYCGYNKCKSALHFHHVDPSTKLFSICRNYKKQKTYPSIEKFATELNKCVLLCAICHCEHHAGLINIDHIQKIIVNPDDLRLRKKKEVLVRVPGNDPVSVAHKATGETSPPNPGSTKILWPNNEDLSILVWTKPLTYISVDLGVSDSAIRKRCRKFGIKTPPQGYWNKQYWSEK